MLWLILPLRTLRTKRDVQRALPLRSIKRVLPLRVIKRALLPLSVVKRALLPLSVVKEGGLLIVNLAKFNWRFQICIKICVWIQLLLLCTKKRLIFWISWSQILLNCFKLLILLLLSLLLRWNSTNIKKS